MKVPKYRKHSTRNYGIIEWRGTRHRLPGTFNSAESRAAYSRFLADHVYSDQAPKAGRTYRPPEGKRLRINGLVLAFLDHSKSFYPNPDDRKSTYQTVKRICAAFSQAYGAEYVDDFGPLKLKDYQQQLVDEGSARSYVNKRIGIIKQMFKWGASDELLAVTVHQAVATVDGLRKGRTAAPDHDARRPVEWSDVAATLPFLPATIQTMVLVQWHTGCRSDSLCNATPSQFKIDDDVLLWNPKHKTDYLGKEVIIPIGPLCRKLIEPLLARSPDAFLFNPRDGRNGSNWRYRDQYDAGSYRQAVKRAQAAAVADARAKNIKLDFNRWTPHQMRHSKGTLIRKRYGIEAARIMLGHSSASVTAIYAERDLELAKRIAIETG